MNYNLNDPRQQEAFLAYWQHSIQEQPLLDLLGLEEGPNAFWCVLLRTEIADIQITVDTAGGRVVVGTIAAEHGQEQEPMIGFGGGKPPVPLHNIIEQGPEQYNLTQSQLQHIIDCSRRVWQRLDWCNVIGKRIDDISLEYTTLWEGYTYCNKIVVRFENCRLSLEDVQDRMHVFLYPSRYTV
jgi:hypothetical protein